MKKLFFLLVLATMTLVACNKDEKENATVPTVSLSAAATQFENGVATVTVSLSEKASSVVTVTLGVDRNVPDGYIPMTADLLVFDETVSISAGETSAKAEIALAKTFDPGQDKYQAVIVIKGADGATVDSKDNEVRFDVKVNNYEGPDGPEDPNKPDDNNEDPGFEGFTYVSDWSVSLLGEPYLYDEYAYYDVDINLPGIQYFWIMALTDAQLAELGGFGGMVAEMEDYIAECLEDGDTMPEIVFSMADEEFYFDYDGEAGEHGIYIMEFGEDGKSTLRYGFQKAVLAACDEDPDDPDEPGESDVYDRIAVNGTADDVLYTFDVYEKGSIATDELEEEMITTGSYPLQADAYYRMLYEMFGMDYPYSPMDFMNDATYNFADFNAMDNGEYDVLIVGLTEDGNLTGEYNISSITVDGHTLAEMKAMKARIDRKISSKHERKVRTAQPARKRIALRDGEEEEEPEAKLMGPVTKNAAWTAVYLGRYEETDPDDPEDPEDPEDPDIELVLQSNWSVTLDGEVYDYDGDLYIDVTVNLPGIQYFWMEENTPDDLDYYYGGTVEGFVQEYQEYYQSYLTQGYEMSDLAWSLDDDYYYLDVYNPGMQTTVYIAEFDEDGNATGRYGKTVVTLPDYEEDDSSYKAPQPARRLRVRVRK